MWDFDDTAKWAVVRHNNLFGYIQKDGTWAIPLQYEDAYDFNVFRSNYNPDTETFTQNFRAKVKKNGKFAIIDKKNNLLSDFIYKEIFFEEPNIFQKDRCLIFAKENENFSILDVNLKEIYPPVITEYHLNFADAEKEEKVPGFHVRIWIQEATQSYYLNQDLQAFGHNVEITQEGFIINKKNENLEIDSYAFIAKNEEGKFGVIRSNNTILIPFLYDEMEENNIWNISTVGGFNRYICKNNSQLDVFVLYQFEGVFQKIYSSTFVNESIHFMDKLIVESTALRISRNKKVGLWSVQKQEFILPLEYDDIFIGYYDLYKENLFTIKENEIKMYDFKSLKTKLVTAQILNDLLNQKYNITKKAKEIIRQNINLFTNQKFNHIFRSNEERIVAKKHFPNLDFDNSEAFRNAFEQLLNEQDLMSDVFIEKMKILETAYLFDAQANPKESTKHLNLGYFYLDTGKELNLYQENALALEYLQKGQNLIPEKNRNYADYLIALCFVMYHLENYEQSIQYGNRVLEWLAEARNPINKDRWAWIKNKKELFEEFNFHEKTIYYYLAACYFDQDESDYQKSKENAEKALAFGGDWKIIDLKYFYVASLERLQGLDGTVHLLEEFITIVEADAEYGKNYQWLWIKYLLAFDWYHNQKNKEKALEIIEEVLAINPEYENCIELKEEINKKNGFFGKWFKK